MNALHLWPIPALSQPAWTLAMACVLSRTAIPSASSGIAVLRSRRERPAPSWRRLYLTLSVTMGLFALAEAVSRGGGWRHVAEFLAVVAIFGGAAVWVRANRVALAEADGCSCVEREIEIRIVDEPQRKGADYEVVLTTERDSTVREGVLTGVGGRPR